MAEYARRRREKILQYLAGHPIASLSELRDLCSASAATIRRDVEKLDGEGAVRRIRGGVALANANHVITTHRDGKTIAAKQAIGRAAVELIEDGDTVFISSGSTMLEIARNLLPRSGVTVITNSLPILNVLSDSEGIQLVAVGGVMRRSERSFVGHLMEICLNEIRADKVFLGIQGIHVDNGLTNENLIETQTDRALVAFAKHVIIAADHTKFGVSKASFVDSLERIQTIVTDPLVPRDMLNEITRHGVEVIIAGSEHIEAAPPGEV
jgi:DeoR/GlpR family transcriptional regulator of sugar metabolism